MRCLWYFLRIGLQEKRKWICFVRCLWDGKVRRHFSNPPKWPFRHFTTYHFSFTCFYNQNICCEPFYWIIKNHLRQKRSTSMFQWLRLWSCSPNLILWEYCFFTPQRENCHFRSFVFVPSLLSAPLFSTVFTFHKQCIAFVWLLETCCSDEAVYLQTSGTNISNWTKEQSGYF